MGIIYTSKDGKTYAIQNEEIFWDTLKLSTIKECCPDDPLSNVMINALQKRIEKRAKEIIEKSYQFIKETRDPRIDYKL